MNLIGALAVGVLLCAAGSSRAANWPPPGLSCAPHLVVVFERGPAADKAKLLFPAHIAFVTAHLKSGELLAMGPSDAGGGLALFQATSWDAARQILADEPFTNNGVLSIAQHFTWTGCELGKVPAGSR